MSRALDSSQWPVSYVEQALFVQKMEAELNRLEAAQQSVVLEQATRPIQKEWEQAYVQQTGRNLPITPGSKLIWWDWRTNRARLHTTAYDLVNGTETSGNVYEWSSTKREQGPYRFLGASGGTGNIWNAQFKEVGNVQSSLVSTPIGSIVLSPDVQMKQQMMAIELYFNLRYSNTATLVLQLRQARTYDNTVMAFASSAAHNLFDEDVKAGPVYARANRTNIYSDYDIELFGVAAEAMDANQRLFGRVILHSPADILREDGEGDVSNMSNMTYQWEAFIFPSTGSAAFRYNNGMGVCRNSFPISEGLTLNMLSLASSPQQNYRSRIWAYGWYGTPYTANIASLGGFYDVP